MLDKNKNKNINNSKNHLDSSDMPIDSILIKKIDSTLENWTVPTNRSKKDIWNAISEKIDYNDDTLDNEIQLSNKSNKYQHIVWKSVAVVASIVVILGLSIFFVGKKYIYNEKGKYTVHTLPDGSTVQLMPNSQIRYNSIMFNYQRDIQLEGEAVFKVKKASKFSVTTSTGQQVIVLGTQFQVYARHNNFEVFCEEGSVGIVNDGKELAKLVQNHGIHINNQNKITRFESKTYSEKINKKFKGIHKYENAPLERVLDDFSNAYGVEVDCIVNNKSYTGQFTTNNIEKALTYICDPFGLKYEIKDKKVIIR